MHQQYQHEWTDKVCKSGATPKPGAKKDSNGNTCKGGDKEEQTLTGNAEWIQRLRDGLELTYGNYPEQASGPCAYDSAGRNWLFAGLKGVQNKACPPPAPPPSSPPPGCDDSTCANGEYATANDPDYVSNNPMDGQACLSCDASCVVAGVGESCTGPEPGDCVKCPYECDVTCAMGLVNSIATVTVPSFADYTSGDLVCTACDSSCTSCTGPTSDDCTNNCNKACDTGTCDTGQYYRGYSTGKGSGSDDGCRACDASCEACTGPTSDHCAVCPMACKIQPTDQCDDGQYQLGFTCMPCDTSCTGAGVGESCTGPGPDECMKCPYQCDPTCDGESSPSFADWTDGGAAKCIL